MQCILISNDIVIVSMESSLLEHVGGGQGLAVGRELLCCGGKEAVEGSHSPLVVVVHGHCPTSKVVLLKD